MKIFPFLSRIIKRLFAVGIYSTKIKTSVGDVVITKVEIVSEDPFGDKADPGHQILYIWFKSADGREIDGDAFYNARKAVYIIGDDGSKTSSYTGGILNRALRVAFTPPESAQKFTLFWPGNDPIEFSLSQ